MSPARNTAAWRTFRFSAAPTTISAPLSRDASTTSPRAAGPVRAQDPRTGAAQGSAWAAPPAGASPPAGARGAQGLPKPLQRYTSLSDEERANPPDDHPTPLGCAEVV